MSRTPLLAGFSLLAVSVMAAVAVSQTQPATRDAPEAPASRPVTQPSADQILGNMLKPRRTGQERELSVTDPPAVDKKSGPGSVAPAAAPQTVMREGTPVVNRIGRITVGAEGAPSEFVFESDGGALRDPPLILLPCLKLMLMEDAARGNSREPRFRVSGVVTEYRGRNYLLLDKVYVLSPTSQQLR